MSDGSDLKQLVADEVSEQIDVADLIGGGSLEDSINGDEIGASVGREFGDRIGRELGGAIGREVHETISEGLEEEKDRSELRSELTSAIKDAFTEALEDLEASDSVASLAKGISEGSSLEDVLESEEDEDGGNGETEEMDEDGGNGETEEMDEDDAVDESEEDGKVADEDSTTDDEQDSDEGDEPDAGDLEGLRKETLEQFLEIMSYSDLQSVAKDVGVKANLSREEMTERIVETVSESDDEFATVSNGG
ncbi:hypothetical protein [Halostagnicola sp. A-GB9-2]|uniref:hypothetical protein n=1 Tax=Halostagnicola sp. A-GB9-2 TaxID=3048066 RepID=UPI0024BFF071|nr:hypothetical protein [Halostagnicola sp. A-GB9-2]MDJ1430563.1 hypothetical protein [Halostagnicola sp. A-GB9-2]